MKVALIVDMPNMPKNCAECLLHYDYLHCIVFENMSVEPEEFDDMKKGYSYTSEYCDYRPPLCKLRPLPERKFSLVVVDGDGARIEEPTAFEQGYNACIDEILGDE